MQMHASVIQRCLKKCAPVSQIDAGYMPRGGVSGGEARIHITTSVLELSVMLKRQNQASLSVEMMHAAIAEAATL